MDKEEARERAVEDWANNAIANPGDLFDRGFDAGAASHWVAVKDESDWPERWGEFIVKAQIPGVRQLLSYSAEFMPEVGESKAGWEIDEDPKDAVVIAYMPIPKFPEADK